MKFEKEDMLITLIQTCTKMNSTILKKLHFKCINIDEDDIPNI